MGTHSVDMEGGRLVWSWEDTDSSAVGWVVMCTVCHALSFAQDITVSPSVTLAHLEEQGERDLRRSSLLYPSFGVTVAGIRATPSQDDEEELAYRFLRHFELLLRSYWVISHPKQTVARALVRLQIPSLVDAQWGRVFPSKARLTKGTWEAALSKQELTLEEAARVAQGDVLCEIVRATLVTACCSKPKPRVAILGFGPEVQAMAYLMWKKEVAMVVAVSASNGLIFNKAGIDLETLLEEHPSSSFSVDERSPGVTFISHSGQPWDALKEADVEAEAVVIASRLEDNISEQLLATVWRRLENRNRFLFFGHESLDWRVLDNNHFCWVPAWVSNCGAEQLHRIVAVSSEQRSPLSTLCRQLIEDACVPPMAFLQSALLLAENNPLQLGNACLRLAENRLRSPLPWTDLEHIQGVFDTEVRLYSIISHAVELMSLLFLGESTLGLLTGDVLNRFVLPLQLCRVYLSPSVTSKKQSKCLALLFVRSTAKFLENYGHARGTDLWLRALQRVRPCGALEDEVSICEKLIAQHRLPCSAQGLQAVVNQVLSSKVRLFLLQALVDSLTGAVPPFPRSPRSARQPTGGMKGAFAEAFRHLTAALLSLQDSPLFTVVGEVAAALGSEFIGSWIEARLDQSSSIENDGVLIEFLLNVARRVSTETDEEEEYCANVKRLPSLLMKLLPGPLSVESAREVVDALVELLACPEALHEFVFFYIFTELLDADPLFPSQIVVARATVEAEHE